MMKLRNAFRILTDNFSNTYKLLLYRLVVGILFFGLSYVVLNIGLQFVITSAELKEIIGLLGKFFESLASGEFAFLETFRETFLDAVKAFVFLLGENIGSIVGSLIGVCALYLVFRFLNGIAIFAMGNIVNDKMALYSRTSFSAAYFKNIGKAALYQVIYVPLCFVYDVLAVAFCWFFFFYAPSLFPSWGLLNVVLGLSLSFAAFLCLEALKMTLVSAWLPAVVTGQSVVGGFKSCFRNVGKGFGPRFSYFLILIYLIVIVNVIATVCTFGSFLLITIPASYLLLLCLQHVCYYEANGMKYYVSFRKIAGEADTPEGMGE